MRYFRTEGWRCPYCHNVLRDSPRQRRDKERRTVLRIDPSKYMKRRREAVELVSP
jgi:pyruvate-formate lyase-activating enzyme